MTLGAFGALRIAPGSASEPLFQSSRLLYRPRSHHFNSSRSALRLLPFLRFSRMVPTFSFASPLLLLRPSGCCRPNSQIFCRAVTAVLAHLSFQIASQQSEQCVYAVIKQRSASRQQPADAAGAGVYYCNKAAIYISLHCPPSCLCSHGFRLCAPSCCHP